MTRREISRVSELRMQIRDCEIHLTTLRKTADNITPKIDGLLHTSTIQSRVENLALKIVEQSRELEKLYSELDAAVAELTEKIKASTADFQERTVLILRYVHCLHFREICFHMKKSDATIFRIHRDALKKMIV